MTTDRSTARAPQLTVLLEEMDMPIEKEDTVRCVAKPTLFAAGLLAASFIILPGAAQAGNMISACKAEIAANCSGVSEGRGRISACLYANDDKLSGTCKTEVVDISNSSSFQRYLPTGVQSLKGSEQEADLRAACTADADKVCTGVKKGNGRFLACVYAQSASVSKECSAAAKFILG
jgi:hypothetical protein